MPLLRLPIPSYRLSFRVQDTGQGIRPEDLAQIFQPFVQLGNERESREGTGLGLAISRGLVEILGGTLQVSPPGRG